MTTPTTPTTPPTTPTTPTTPPTAATTPTTTTTTATTTSSPPTVGRLRRPLWVIWRLVAHRPWLFACHLGHITTAVYIVPFIFPLLIKQLFDGLTGGRPVAFDLTTVLVLIVAHGLVRAAFELFGPVLVVTLRQHAHVLMRRNMLHRVLHRPGARALPSSPGEALVRFQHDPEHVTYALDFIADPLGQAIAFTVAFAVLASIDLFLTLAVVVPAVAVMLTARLATPRIMEARRKRQEAHGDVTGLLGDAFSAVGVIQAANAQDRITHRLDQLNEARRRTTLRDLLVDQAVMSVASHAAAIATGVLLLLAASGARSGRLTAGDFAVFTSYLAWLSTVVSFAGHVVTTLRQAEVSVERMADVVQPDDQHRGVAVVVEHHPIHLRGPLPVVDPPPERVPLERFDVEGLTFTYPDSGRGIVDVDLTIERGEVVAVTGRIASGKTTLARALLGLLPNERGTIRWNGTPLDDPATFLVPPHAAYTPQVPRLFSASLRENVLLGANGNVERAARQAVLDADVVTFEDGWDTRVGPRGVKLSGGQVQRTAAARMFVRDAELLVLDDLSSALDVETEEELWRRLFERSGLTCIVVTHRRAVLQRADRVLVMRDGRLRPPRATTSRRS